MRIRTIAAAAATIAAGSLTATGVAPAAPTAPASQSASRHVEGTVLSVNAATRTFRLRDAERGTFTIKVTSRTSFERVGSFSGLRAGMTRIEASIRRANGGWVARHVERSGGGGRHGGR